jgi:hypothetical protein
MNTGNIITGYCTIRHNQVIVNGNITYFQENFINFADFIKSAFKKEEISYSKFFKMDALSKLGFLSTEFLLREKGLSGYPGERTGVVLCNSSSSLDTDMGYFETIRNRNEYYPSPSVFVYTLPNIMIGEICIRNRIKGENSFFVQEHFDTEFLSRYVNELFENNRIDACITGWAELLKDRYESLVLLVERADLAEKSENFRSFGKFSKNTLDNLYKNLTL